MITQYKLKGWWAFCPLSIWCSAGVSWWLQPEGWLHFLSDRQLSTTRLWITSLERVWTVSADFVSWDSVYSKQWTDKQTSQSEGWEDGRLCWFCDVSSLSLVCVTCVLLTAGLCAWKVCVPGGPAAHSQPQTPPSTHFLSCSCHLHLSNT